METRKKNDGIEMAGSDDGDSAELLERHKAVLKAHFRNLAVCTPPVSELLAAVEAFRRRFDDMEENLARILDAAREREIRRGAGDEGDDLTDDGEETEEEETGGGDGDFGKQTSSGKLTDEREKSEAIGDRSAIGCGESSGDRLVGEEKFFGGDDESESDEKNVERSEKAFLGSTIDNEDK